MKNNLALIIITCLLLLMPTDQYAQLMRSGPQVNSFHSSVDDTEQPYGLYIPPNFNKAQKYPLVVMLHGAGSNHRLALKRVFGKSNVPGETDVEASKYFQPFDNRNFIVVTPYARGTMGYQGIAEKDVLDVLADVKKRFRIDEDRTYLTGLSMGGGGSLWIGLAYPDIWAAIAPVCPAPPTGSKEKLANALNIPLFFHQGGADGVVPPEGTRAWVEEMKKEGVAVQYEEYPDVQHDSWVNAYKEAQVFDWFAEHKRNLYPDRVKYATQHYRHQKAYWVTINEFDPGQTASVDANFTADNALAISTNYITALTLNLTEHAKFNAKKKLKIEIDGTSLKLDNQSSLTLIKTGSKWTQGNYAPTGLAKKDRLEGPMKDVLSDRHIYVYGTADNPDEAELERRRKVAQTASEWSYYRGEFLGRIMVFPRVLKDSEVRESDIKEAHLVLFGDKNTNAVIDQFADQLPMELTNSEDYGMALIYPNNGRYVFVNTGISILDAPEHNDKIDGLSKYASPKVVFAMSQFKDFAVYQKDKVLVDGIFQNDWKISPADKKLLERTNAVKLK